MPQVSIIILNWNQPEFTVNCVKSVLEQDYKDFEILLVDNGSDDNSVERFRKEFSDNPKIRLIENSKNLGYAGGNNEGARQAQGEYVVILNNDTLVEKDWLNNLVEGIEGGDDVGSISSIEIREGKKSDWNFKLFGFTLTLLGYFASYTYKNELKERRFVDIFSIKGVSFIYKKKLVDLPFDSEYFIYAEDTYLGWLLKLKGYRNLLSTKYALHHFHNVVKKTSTRRMRNYFVYLGERNRMMNLLLFYEPKNLIKTLPLAVFGAILLNLSEPNNIVPRIRSYLWILSHPRKIMQKRRHIQKQRVVSDEKIIRQMSCKFYDKVKVNNKVLGIFLTFVNGMFHLYCKIVKLDTIEMS
ncbi:MAG: glycosyltransferase family 2 protein [Nanoarchaeota archaeon]|nr:glycosyltransferase family 2 protein [Nanoarchaeota archaeon]MCG2717782.1 glycosyltransferase family 2 protein [Nanoarchaeota archaeon]